MSRRCRGFTLIELLLVTTLLVILAGVIFPRMSKPVRARSLETNASDLAHFVRFARREAMRLEEDLTLHFSEDGASYWLSRGEARDGVGSDEVPRFFEERYHLSAGIAIDEIARNHERVKVREVVLSPSGSGPEMSYRIRDGQGATRYVVSGAWVDDVSVEREESSEPKEERE